MSESKRQCEVCHVEFSARRATARFCGGTCRQRAHRANRVVTGFELLMPKEALDLAASQIVDEFVGKAGKTARLMLWEYRIVDKLTPFLSGEAGIPKKALVDVLGADYLYYESPSNLLTRIRERLESFEKELQYEKDSVGFYREMSDSYRKMYNNLVSRGAGGELKGLSTEDWESLAQMEADQLVQWAKVGRALNRQGRSEAGQDAVRWVQGNRMDPSKGSNANGNATVDPLVAP